MSPAWKARAGASGRTRDSASWEERQAGDESMADREKMLEEACGEAGETGSPGEEASRLGSDPAALAGGCRPVASPVWAQFLNEDKTAWNPSSRGAGPGRWPEPGGKGTAWTTEIPFQSARSD